MEASAIDPRSHGAERAYEAIAPVYDSFTAHHDYELWLGELLPALYRNGLHGNRLLDIACGTGKSFLPMLARGWDVTACDISSSMLELANGKVGDAVHLAVADMRELPVFGQFDLVWALDDAMNYLLSEEELGCAVRGMRANMSRSGLLMFDVNTLRSFRTFFAETEMIEHDGLRLVWTGLASSDVPPGSISEARFEVKGPDAPKKKVHAHIHRQRHFPEAKVLQVLEASDLECLDVFGHGHDAALQQPVDELTHTKMVYIARRA